MVEQLTDGIKVSVETRFESTFYRDYKMRYVFSYIVTIENTTKDPVQLTSRHWEINDALNTTEIVDGDGVIGEKPIILPGKKHIYGSNCMLLSPFGAMKGYYIMVNLTGTRRFRVMIPSFKLSQTSAMN
ncbi:MAG: Co2+/Mg2+ efflux protein ApaG [Flavobacteriales bacterium]|jgi:ApaG protein|tara:strand:+ start:1046 stop:1432 length:387 start_codon:yes stop_codon:yes gene_type:complete